MDVKQAQLERDRLEERIRIFISDQLQMFEQDTGVSVERVDVHIVEFGIIGDNKAKYIVQDVSCKVDF